MSESKIVSKYLDIGRTEILPFLSVGDLKDNLLSVHLSGSNTVKVTYIENQSGNSKFKVYMFSEGESSKQLNKNNFIGEVFDGSVSQYIFIFKDDDYDFIDISKSKSFKVYSRNIFSAGGKVNGK